MQPRPELTGSNETGSETEASNERGSKDGYPRHGMLVQLSKHSWCVMLHGKCVQQSCSCKEGVISGREHTRENDGVDDASCRLCARHLEDDGEGGCVGLLGVEVRVRVGDVEADEEDGEDVEEEDTPEDVLDDLGHGACGVLGFTGGDGDGLGSSV